MGIFVLLQILTRILGDTLYYPKTSEALSEFPSPESLKRRIIVSTKPPKESFVPKAAVDDKALVKELEKEDAQEETSSTPIKEGSAAHRIGNLSEASVLEYPFYNKRTDTPNTFSVFIVTFTP